MRAGEPVAEARKKLEDADLDIPLLVDDEDRPLGWLSERGLQGERVSEELRSEAEPIVELDDILRDALSDLLGSDSQYGPVVDADGRGCRCAVDGGPLPRAQPEGRATCRRRRSWPPTRSRPRPDGAIATWLPTLAQITFGDRKNAVNECPGNNNLCPGWIVDNFNQYWNPLWEHVLLSVVPLFDRLLRRDRDGAARAPLQGRSTGGSWRFVSALFTVPSIAFYLILLNVTGRGFTTAVVVLTAYTLVLIYRNVSTGLQEVPQRHGRRG